MGGSNHFGMNNHFDNSNEEDNWDESAESDPEPDFTQCEERAEFIFENRARYKGQWKGSVRHG